MAEKRAAEAIREALRFLYLKVERQGAALSAVSSIARGGDVLFAQLCQADEADRPAIPWKCLLPFREDDFLRLDLAEEPNGTPIGHGERLALRQRAERCLALAQYETETCCNIDAQTQKDERVTAYLECGYRTVDEADVLVFLVRADEFRRLSEREVTGHDRTTASKAGTLAVARYALASGRPCIVLDVDSDAPWRDRLVLNDPSTAGGEYFHDPLVTPLVRRAVESAEGPVDSVIMPPGPDTPARRSVLRLQARLGGLASQHQGSTQGGLKAMLSLHLAATSIAALAATVLHFGEYPAGAAGISLAIGLLALAYTKPVLAWIAERIENRLHHDQHRENWLHARELAELCRGALSLWPLPVQPLDAADDEDFPKFKRLHRTLRLMRSLRSEAALAAVSGASPKCSPDPSRPWEGETPLEAAMREATRMYVEGRLVDQAEHYERRQRVSQRLEGHWRRIYLVAIWSAIGLGFTLALFKTLSAFHLPHPPHAHLPFLDIYNWLSTAVIIAPFVASFALGMMTILDCRRRASRYGEMHGSLMQLAKTLSACEANASRIRLIEHAERMMIEEQHEWFSVTRNFSV